MMRTGTSSQSGITTGRATPGFTYTKRSHSVRTHLKPAFSITFRSFHPRIAVPRDIGTRLPMKSLQWQQYAATSTCHQSPVDTRPLSEYRPTCRAFQLPRQTSVQPFSNFPSPHPRYAHNWRYPTRGNEPQSSCPPESNCNNLLNLFSFEVRPRFTPQIQERHKSYLDFQP